MAILLLMSWPTGSDVLYAAAIVVGIGALWTKLIKPMATLITLHSQVLPLLEELVKTVGQTPKTITVLNEIAGQFRTNHGSSLRDIVNKLQEASEDQKVSAAVLKVGVETARVLAEQDRMQLHRLIGLLEGVTVKIEQSNQTGIRIEAAAVEVADDLKNAHLRADKIARGDHGAAADAAARPTAKERREENE